MAKAKTDKVKIIVRPATDNAHKEGFVKVNGKVIPFEVPMIVTEMDARAIERIKEPRAVNKDLDPRAIMEQLKISQEKANRIAREGDIKNSGIKYVQKYYVQRVG